MVLPDSNLEGDPGPKYFPLFSAILIIGSSLALILKKTDEAAKPFLNKTQWKRLAVMFCVIAGYAFVMWLLGYVISTIITLYYVNYLFCEREGVNTKSSAYRIKTAVYSITITVIIYFVFHKGLQMILPQGLLFK
jgi:hypothetical protein